jgi:tetratricopeptide (TPR) repeat protein
MTTPHSAPRPLSPEDRTWLEEATSEARRQWASVHRSGSPEEKGQALAHLSACAADLEGPLPALRLARRAFRFYRAAGDPTRIAHACGILAVRFLEAGRTREALAHAAEALEGLRALEPRQRHPGLMRCLGRTFLGTGHAAAARAWLELALESLKPEDRGEILEGLAGLLPPAEARERRIQACAAYSLQGNPTAMARLMLPMARHELASRRPWEAETLCMEALEHLGKGGHAAEAIELLQLCRRQHRSRPREARSH